MITDRLLMSAVSKILQRSERQIDSGKLIATFVDTGILPQLDNRNHQIFYGRRGTGKTHVLRVLESNLISEGANVTVYIDARTLGSTSQFSDMGKLLSVRCLALFRDVMLPVRDALLEYISEHPSEKSEAAIDSLREFESCLSGTYSEIKDQEVKVSKVDSESRGFGLGKELFNASTSAESKAEKEISYKVDREDKIIFPAIHEALKKILEYAKITLYILIDEWSALPSDVQPYLAEFLRRGVLPLSGVVVKIAALEYRSRFELSKQGTGFELGADVAATLHLDDYYVFDKSPEEVTRAFSNMLLKHLTIGLPDDYFSSKKIFNGEDLQSKLFTERKVFKELSRASEGVVRDFINIFTKAFFDSCKRQRDSIDRLAVTSAAREWFEQDKAQHLSSELNGFLRRVMTEVIGNRKARSFLVPRDFQGHPVLQGLFDARVLHLVQRGYADKDNPGLRYDIYTLDYGTYVELMGTSKQPSLDFAQSNEGEDVVVPFDDKRSIRRIIIDAKVLSGAVEFLQ